MGTAYTGLLLTQEVGSPSRVYRINDNFEWVPGEPHQFQSHAVPAPPAVLVALAGLSWCVGSRRRSGGLA